MALTKELKFAIGYKKQTDLTTALAAADMLSLSQTNTDIIKADPINEDDSQDLGKGVYATNVYPSHIDANGPWNGRLTTEAAALLFGFGIGKLTKTAAGGGFKYTASTPNLISDGLDLPATSMVVQLGNVSDKMLIGMCCEELGIQLRSGAGRDNAQFTSQWIGTGKYAKPSGITIPAAYGEHSLNAGNLSALTLVGFDYLANKRFTSVDFGWKNNIRDQSSYYPGSGAQNNYQLRGRMRRGTPTITLRATVECASGSSEEDALLSQTEGTGVITMDGAQIGAGPEKHQLKITFARLRVRTAQVADSDGIASYNIEYTVLEHTSNGVLTVEITCEQDNILAAAA